MRKFIRISLIVVAAVIAAIFAGLLLLPPLSILRSGSEMPVKALSNLKTYYVAITMYADDHDGAYPPDLQALIGEDGFMKEPPGGVEFLNSPDLHYFAPPSGVNQKTAPLSPETVLLRYNHGAYQAVIKADGSGRVEKRPVESP